MANASNALPPLVVSPSDLKRIKRELEQLDEFLHQAGLRQGGKAMKLPPTSRLLDEMAAESGLNLLKKTDRDRLNTFIKLLLAKAPVLHMSFASEPSAAFLQKLTLWMRHNIHSQVLLQVGLQPGIAAGCVLRTANRQFDFSLRESMDAQTGLLIKNLRAPAPADNAPRASVAAAAQAADNAPKAATTAKATTKIEVTA